MRVEDMPGCAAVVGGHGQLLEVGAGNDNLWHIASTTCGRRPSWGRCGRLRGRHRVPRAIWEASGNAMLARIWPMVEGSMRNLTLVTDGPDPAPDPS